VAVLDTGVDASHPELRGCITAQADFVNLEGLDTSEFIGDFLDYDALPEDEVGHGTHVSGIIAGVGVNMPAGVATGCSLIAVRTLASLRTPDGPSGAGIVDNINVAMKWAVDQGAHVINASLGIKHTGGGLPHAEVIDYAISRGVTVVAASGNDGTSEKYYPGALPGVIAVGATDMSDGVASFSSYGAPVALVAPGTNIMSSDTSGGYKLASGTSQASPFVAGAAALLRSQAARRGVQLADADIKAIFMHTSDKDSASPRTPRRGYGRLNVLDACRLLHHTLDERGIRHAA
jgi:thermitase